MAFEIKGLVVHIGKTNQVTEKLKKRELVVEYAEPNSQYKEEIKFEAVNDKCAALDELRVGDEVNVHFNLRGRSYNDKTGNKAWFNSLGLWKYDVLKTTAGTNQGMGGYTNAPTVEDSPDPF
jgi:hypothetical protein